MKKESNKTKAKAKKEITLDLKSIANKFGDKTFYILNQFNFQHLDINSSGQIFYNINERLTNQKWLFEKSENSNDIYYIKNAVNDLYLCSDAKGEIFSSMKILNDDFIKWKIIKSTENDIFVICNLGNGFYLDSNKMNAIFLNYLKTVTSCSLFNIYPKKIKK